MTRIRTPRTQPRPSRASLVLASFWLCLAAPLAASLVVEHSFLQLHQNAGTIFHGKCVARKEVPDGEPLPYTEYTFEVIEAVRGCKDSQGKPLRTITFRHAGTRKGRVRADGLEEAPLRFGIPEHDIGEEAVLFLTKESSAGLCAPVGLEQGKFQVIRENRKAFVRNHRRAGLFEKVETSAFRALADEEGGLLSSPDEKLDLKCFLGLCAKVKE